MITVFVTAHASARDSEFLSQSYAFMTLGARVGRYCCRSGRRLLIERHGDVVNAVAVCTNGGARYSTGHGLSVNTLNELTGLCPVTLSAGSRNVDFGNR